MSSSEGQARAEERELATKAAAAFIRARFGDEEAWVRLLVTEGVGPSDDLPLRRLRADDRRAAPRDGLPQWRGPLGHSDDRLA